MRRIRLKVFVRISLITLCFMAALLLYFREVEDVDKSSKIKIIERSIRSLMNQGECRHPNLPIDNADIMKFYKPVQKLDCGNALDDWVMCDKSICFVKPEISASHKEVTCSYTDIIRKTDYKMKYGKTTKTKEPYVLQQSDFAKVACRAENGESWYGMVYGVRDNVPRRLPPILQQPPFPAAAAAVPSINADDLSEKTSMFNVLMFGFDSLSRNAVMRTLPKTYEYLTQKLGAIVLKGYNIVGDGTPQAFIPLLTGYTELELPETRKRMPNSYNVDVYPMIWKDYARYGYVTSYNEDIPLYSTFSYRMNGFDKQPVDHYLRTFYQEINNIWPSNKDYCIGHQPDHLVMLDYTKMFMLKYNDAPKFIISFHGGLSHDSINLVSIADADVLNWLTTLNAKGIFKNTILIFMADHGNRFSEVRATLQGKQEERLPFFSFAFPQAFKKRFPKQFANFMNNVETLSTPFDVHETLKDILALQVQDHTTDEFAYDDTSSINIVNEPNVETTTSIQISELARGRAISLFDNIPKNRSCANAYIEPHWCACLNWQPLQLNDTANTGLMLKLANSIVLALNTATNNYRNFCEELKLQQINWVMRLRPHEELLQFKQNSDRDGFLADMSGSTTLHQELYQLQISVLPGASLFEASVSYNLQDFSAVTKLSDVSRINKYGEQANCIYERNPELRKYCYCRT